ncbi:MAG TPA: carboxypeptidase-like regulatory domain-containing protein [Pyrinomonadaceae bacterium]
MPIQSRLLSLITIVGVLFFLTLIVNAQSLEPKPKPNGSISGRITIDGKGAAGIPVAAVEGQNVNRRDAPARALSDVEGNYQISGLAPSEYQVWTLTPAFVAEPSGSPNYFPNAGAAKSILLGAGENVTGVDLKLIRGSVITGRVTNAENKPVVEEHIRLQLLDANGNPRLGGIIPNYDQMFQTDDRGVYRIFDLPPGRYKVSSGYDPASDGMLRGRGYEQTFYLDPNDQSKPGIVELSEADEAKNIDIRVGTAPASYTVSGRVVDSETGVPISKASVGFNMVRKDQNQPVPGFIVQTDERGEFYYSGFATGHYIVTASSEFYGGNFYSDPVSFDVTDKDVTGLEIRTVPGLSVSGYITADALSTKELISLLPNLLIVASGAAPGNNQIRNGGRALVAPDGTFEIGGLRTGPVSLFVSTQRPSFIRANINRMEREGVAVNQNFVLKESLSGLHVVIDYGTGIIRGTVRFEGNDAPITDSRMYVSCKRAGARDGNGAQVDARGRFVMANLAPGSWEVTLQVNSLTPRPPRGIPIQKQIVNVTNGSETEVTFVVALTPKQGGP